MDNITKDILQKFADDERMFEIVKNELIETKLKQINLEISNEKIGAEYRARERAVEIIESGFKKIRLLRSGREKQVSINPAR